MTTELIMSRKNTTNTTIEAAANPVPTLSPQALQALIEEVTALRSAVAKAEANASVPKVSMAGKTEQQIKNEIATVRAFKKLGITAKPHVDTFTFNKWVSKGFRPKEGSKSIKAGGLRLFHVSQVRKLTADELKAREDQPAAAAAQKAKGKGATVTPLHPQ
jgi:hypothetical protein